MHEKTQKITRDVVVMIIYNYLQGEYGEKGISSFIQLATKSGICISSSIKVICFVKTYRFGLELGWILKK